MSTSARTIDLNADLGEGCPHDEELLDRVSSASVSCGFHAGDRASIVRTLRAAKERGVAVGAHPGFADREGFGRRERDISEAEVGRLIVEQFDALAAMAAEDGMTLRFVKPHGALYNQAQRQDEVAEGVVAAMVRLGLPVLGQPGSVLEARAAAAGVRFVAEGFPDRRYRPDGRLVPRTEPGAVLDDPAEVEAQVVRLVGRGGIATLCIHGDDPRAVRNADLVLTALSRNGIGLTSFAR
jgi:5-oxoprolinase (ATP-hydrolysing) subunit A